MPFGKCRCKNWDPFENEIRNTEISLAAVVTAAASETDDLGSSSAGK
jgi:hypothetical protein